MEGTNFRVYSININGINKEKLGKLTQLRTYDFDLLFLQETHNGLTDETKVLLEKELDCIIIKNDPLDIDKKAGVAICIKNKPGIRWEKLDEGIFFKGRLLHIRIENRHYINIYMPTLNPQRVKFVDEFIKYISNYVEDDMIIGGDFNWVDSLVDRTGELTPGDRQIRDQMTNAIKSLHLIDIYRKLNLPKIEYTFLRGPQESRIDTFWGTSFGTQNYIEAKILDFKISDHKLIYIKTGFKNRNKWGPGSWKINNNLLEDLDFITEIKNEINNFKERGNLDIITEWDNLKQTFRTIAQKHARIRSKKLKLELEAIRNLLNTNPSQDIKETLELRLNKIKQEQNKGRVIKAGLFSKIYEDAGHFYKREELRRGGGGAKMLETLNDNGETLTDKQEVLDYIYI